MYSNYLLNPNFESTNVSALEGKKRDFLFYFKEFQYNAGSFFLIRGGLRVVCDSLKDTGSENQHISRMSRVRK